VIALDRRAPFLAFALALALGVGAPAACNASAPPPGRGEPAAAPTVVVSSPSGRSSRVKVELARTPAEQERGLMFREKLGADEGMLFIFPSAADHAFWMKNTLIPLDMIFIDDAGAVVGVVANAEPLSLSPRSVGVPSRYVLEVNGGWSAAHGVANGDKVRFEGIPGL
jgi:uncharacterized membrane protein (UPF0127 family)